MDKIFDQNKYYTSRRLRMKNKNMLFDENFNITHYAGDVTYSVIGFIDKNRDTLYQDIKRLLYSRYDKSSTQFLEELFELGSSFRTSRRCLHSLANILQQWLLGFSKQCTNLRASWKICVLFCSKSPLLHSLFPDGAKSVNEVNKRPLTAGTMFKVNFDYTLGWTMIRYSSNCVTLWPTEVNYV